MITQANDIKRFFEKLGLKLKIHKPQNKTSVYARHIMEVMPGGKIGLDRAEPLLDYYFKSDARHVDYDKYSVILDNFNADGHGQFGVCKICGCTENDACENELGHTCWWVKDDLCSACATKEELTAATEKRKELFKEEQR